MSFLFIYMYLKIASSATNVSVTLITENYRFYEISIDNI